MSEAVVSSNGYSYCNDDCLPLSYLIARAGPVTIPDYSALVGLATTWGRPIFEKRDDGSWLKRERLTLPTLTETERRWRIAVIVILTLRWRTPNNHQSRPSSWRWLKQEVGPSNKAL